MSTVLVTGAGRGLGSGLTQAYLERGDTVLAGYRSLDRAPGLQNCMAIYGDRLFPLPLEVASQESIRDALSRAHDVTDSLDVLINNAAIGQDEWADWKADGRRVFDARKALEVFAVNAVGALIVAQTFAAMLIAGRGPRIVNVSSDMGSLTLRERTETESYAASKAALNMYTRTLAWDLRDDGVIVVAVHPGWVASDMGGPNATLSLDEASGHMIALTDRLTLADSGKYFRYDGSAMPW